MPGEKGEPQENTPLKRENELVCVDLDRNIWVRMGFPTSADNGVVTNEVLKNLSGPPYVFTADRLTLIDSTHPYGARLDNVTVIFMHGGREGTGPWMMSSFEDGYPVVETVNKVNKYLRENGRQPIQVIMACNDSESPEGVKVGDFPASSRIVYAVGETVGIVRAAQLADGATTATIKAKDFWNLDDLVVEQQIKIV